MADLLKNIFGGGKPAQPAQPAVKKGDSGECFWQAACRFPWSCELATPRTVRGDTLLTW